MINTLRNSGTWELCDIPEQENTEVVTITAYYPEDEELQPRLTQIDEDLINLETRIGKCRFGNTRFRTVSEQDWANEWKQYFHVTHIGRTLVIKPTWETIPEEHKDKLLVQIDPGTAFGTGMHETTQLCIRQLKKYVNRDTLVLDVGTGSGILGITALKLGAKEVWGTDLDENAINAVRENLEANSIPEDRFHVLQGNIIDDVSVKEWAGYGKYDVAVANILADVILSLIHI